MFKKILIGMLAAAVFGGIAVSGYEFGQYLAERDSAKNADAKSGGNKAG